MSLPNLPAGDKLRREVRTEWGGLNLTESAQDGELVEALDLSSREYPLIATRRGRSAWPVTYASLVGMFLAEENDGTLASLTIETYNQTPSLFRGYAWTNAHTYVGPLSGPQSFAQLGDKVYLFPDKKVYDLTAHTLTSMEATYSGTDLAFTDGSYEGVNSVSWSYNGSGAVYTLTQQDPESASLLVFTRKRIESGSVTVARNVPALRFVFAHENRLWGCREDTIYASALGNPCNFNVFDGLASDSWTADVESAGSFRAGLVFQGMPILFKRQHVYKVMGDAPSNFGVIPLDIPGISNAASLTVIRGVLYYISERQVLAWSGGGTPTVVSAALGLDGNDHIQHADCALGTDGNRLYMLMGSGTADANYDYVYDTRFGIWHRESFSTPWKGFCTMRDYAVAWTSANVYTLGYGDIGTSETWTAIFADSTRAYKTVLTGSESKKGVLRLLIRCKLTKRMDVYLSYDGGSWEKATTVGGDYGADKDSYLVPLILRRCDYWQLKLAGVGAAVIYSISVERYGGEWQQPGTPNTARSR